MLQRIPVILDIYMDVHFWLGHIFSCHLRIFAFIVPHVVQTIERRQKRLCGRIHETNETAYLHLHCGSSHRCICRQAFAPRNQNHGCTSVRGITALCRIQTVSINQECLEAISYHVKYHNKRIFKLFENQDLFSEKNLY